MQARPLTSGCGLTAGEPLGEVAHDDENCPLVLTVSAEEFLACFRTWGGAPPGRQGGYPHLQ